MGNINNFEFFYGGPLSNWYPARFQLNGLWFNCSEQYMMYMKAKLFEDEEMARAIMYSNSPAQQKRFGKKVKNFNIDKWAEVARDIVYDGCYAKFTQDALCHSYLTGSCKGKELVEASPTDVIWGIGRSMYDNIDLTDKRNWSGLNWLGEVLMKVRDDILAGGPTTNRNWKK